MLSTIIKYALSLHRLVINPTDASILTCFYIFLPFYFSITYLLPRILHLDVGGLRNPWKTAATASALRVVPACEWVSAWAGVCFGGGDGGGVVTVVLLVVVVVVMVAVAEDEAWVKAPQGGGGVTSLKYNACVATDVGKSLNFCAIEGMMVETSIA